MKRIHRLHIGLLLLLAAPAPGQQDPLAGRWEGMVRSPQGERKATVTFKKERASYTGAISGVGGTTEVPFKEIEAFAYDEGQHQGNAGDTPNPGGPSQRQNPSLMYVRSAFHYPSR